MFTLCRAHDALELMQEGAWVSKTRLPIMESNKEIFLEAGCIKMQACMIARFLQLDSTRPGLPLDLLSWGDNLLSFGDMKL